MKVTDEIRRCIAYLHEALAYRQRRLTELTTSTANLDLTITEWVESRKLKEELKELKAAIDDAVNMLAYETVPLQLDMFNAQHNLAENAHINHALGKVIIRNRTTASIQKGKKEAAHDWLRAHDLGGIIIATVPWNTLSATAKELMDNGKDLSPDYFTVTTRRYAAFEADKDNRYATQEA